MEFGEAPANRQGAHRQSRPPPGGPAEAVKHVWQDRTGIPAVMAPHDPELAAAAARHGLRVIRGAEPP